MKKRSRNAVDPSLILEHEGGGRKRAKASHFEAESSTSARSKAAASAGSIIGNGEMTAAIHDRIVSITKSMVYFKDKATKRKLSDIFLEKPCPQTYPDYYQIVDKPIGMNDILRKGRAKLYSSINDFRDDWNLLFKNASTYNGEGSWIVADGKVLKAELEKLMDIHRYQWQLHPSPGNKSKAPNHFRGVEDITIKLPTLCYSGTDASTTREGKQYQ